jgi:hypothetical protein
LIKIHGRHGVCSDGVSWYPEACDSPGLEHKLPSPFEKSIIERVLEYVKYTCIKEGLYETCLQLDSASTLKSEL